MLLIAACILFLSPLQDSHALVEKALDGLHLAAALADESAYFEHFTPEATFLGTDANERWSVEQFRAYAHPVFGRGQGWTYLATERHVRFDASGAVAWFDERLQNEKYGEVRGSGVLERVGQAWKIAQYNLSFPLPNGLAEDVVEKTAGLLRVGEPVGDEFVVEDGERSLIVWNKVVASQLEKDPAERPVVVLLPTASFSARAVWDLPLREYSVMNAMAERGFDVFAVELGGYGLSSSPTDVIAGGCKSAVRDLRLALDAIAKRRGVEQVVLVGLSWGSQVAARFAAENPDRVRGLVLYGYLWRSRIDEQAMREYFGDDAFEQPTRVIDEQVARADFVDGQFEADVPAAFTRFLLSQGRRAPSGALLDYVRELPVCQPAQLSMPTLMLYGRSEFVPASADPQELAKRQAQRIEQREFFSGLGGARRWIEVPRAGHTAHLDRAHQLVQGCLIGWIGRL